MSSGGFIEAGTLIICLSVSRYGVDHKSSGGRGADFRERIFFFRRPSEPIGCLSRPRVEWAAKIFSVKTHFPVDIFGTVVGESPDCLLLSGTVVGENPDYVCWV